MNIPPRKLSTLQKGLLLVKEKPNLTDVLSCMGVQITSDYVHMQLN